MVVRRRMPAAQRVRDARNACAGGDADAHTLRNNRGGAKRGNGCGTDAKLRPQQPGEPAVPASLYGMDVHPDAGTQLSGHVPPAAMILR